jgi:sRNA-binding protein
MIEWMRTQWPMAFSDPPRPLAIGVGKIIAAGKSRSDISAAPHFYTNRDDYLESLAREGMHRVGLDGSDAGPVEDSHREHRERLEKREASRRESEKIRRTKNDESQKSHAVPALPRQNPPLQ